MKKTGTIRKQGKLTLHIPLPINYRGIQSIPFSICPWTCNCIPFCLVPFWSSWHLLPPWISKAMSSRLYPLHKDIFSLTSFKIASQQFQWLPQVFVFKENKSCSHLNHVSIILQAVAIHSKAFPNWSPKVVCSSFIPLTNFSNLPCTVLNQTDMCEICKWRLSSCPVFWPRLWSFRLICLTVQIRLPKRCGSADRW